MDWSKITDFTIPEGNVIQVARNNTVLWSKPTMKELPEGYTEVEYIGSTGTQYLNTGINGDKVSGFEVDAFVKSNTGMNVQLLGGAE